MMSRCRKSFLGDSLGFGRFMAIVAAVFALCTATAIALPHDPYIRFQNLKGTIYERMSWIYERIHYDDKPIDVAFLGSSRSGAGIYPTLLEPALAARGIKARVVNFALPSTGFDIRETIAAELLATRRVKLIVFDVIEALPRDGHEAFGEVASTAQMFNAPWLVNRQLPRNLMRLPLRQINLAIASAMPEAFGFQSRFNPATYAGSTTDPRSMLNIREDFAKLGTPAHEATLEMQSQLRHRQIQPPILPAAFAGVEFGVSRSYIDRVVALAAARDVKFAFLFLPFYKGPRSPLEESWLKRRAPVWTADFMIEDPSSFEDSAHLAASPKVKAALTDWIADQVTPLLK